MHISFTKNKNYCANLNEKDLTDNKQLWSTIKTLLSDKIKLSKKIARVEQRETLDTDGNIGNEIVNERPENSWLSWGGSLS